MKKGWMLLVAAAILALAGGVVRAETGDFIQIIQITGYQPGEYAVKGKIEEEVKALITEIRNKYGDKKLNIAVVGSADVSGKSAENDDYARLRAEQVANILSHEFPNAKINFWSEGEENNVRQVRVMVSAQVYSKTLLAIIGIALIAAVVLPVSIVRRKNKLKKEIGQIQNFGKPSETEWVMAEALDGKRYDVQIKLQNDKWHTPFTLEDGNPLFREKRQGARNAVKWFLKKPGFIAQKEALIKARVIKMD
jgi:uncharacterized protein YeeX (DUF496 family)